MENRAGRLSDDCKDDTGNDPVRSFVLIVSGDEATLRKLFEQYGGTLAEVDSVTVG